MKSHGVSRELAWIGLFVALTALMTHPLVFHLSNAVSDQGDPYLNAWTLHWDYRQALHHPLGLFQANILYPYRDTLAMSENLFGISLLVWPLFAAGAGPLLAHGVAEFLGFALCGYAAFRLCRTAFGSTGAALLGGVVFAFIPFRFSQLPHLTYVFAVWIPLTLEALILFSRKRSWPSAFWLGFAFLMNGLTSVHWFVLTTVPFVLTGLILITASDRAPKATGWLKAIASLGIASFLLFLFLSPYREVARLYSMTRGPGEVAFWSGRPVDWINFAPSNRLYHGLSFGKGAAEGGLAPGILPVLSGLMGFLLTKKKAMTSLASSKFPSLRGLRILDVFFLIFLVLIAIYTIHGPYHWTIHGVRVMRVADPARVLLLLTAVLLARLLWRLPAPFYTAGRPSLAEVIRQSRYPVEVWVGAVWCVIGFAGSLGMNFFFHRALFDLSSVFRSIRVPTRWCMVSYLGIALLSAFGTRALLLKSGKFQRVSPLILLALVGLQLLEFLPAPLSLHRGETVAPPIYKFLRRTPMRGGIVELPTGGWIWDGPYILRSSFHEKPLITAYSGFVPPVQQRIADDWRSLTLDEKFQRFIEGIPTSYLVIHTGELEEKQLAAISRFIDAMTELGRLRYIASSGPPEAGDLLYAVTSIEPSALPLASLATKMTLSDESIPLFFDKPLTSGSRIRGPIWIGGWARSREGDVDVRVVLDGQIVATSPERYSRPDVSRVFPELGDSSKAGFSLTLLPEDVLLQRHSLIVEAVAPNGHIRRFGPYHLEWSK